MTVNTNRLRMKQFQWPCGSCSDTTAADDIRTVALGLGLSLRGTYPMTTLARTGAHDPADQSLL